MKITPYLSTTCLSNIDYRETLRKYAEENIQKVELGYCSNTSINLSKLVNQYPFEFSAHNYFLPVEDEFILNLASQNNKIRSRSVKYVCDAIEFCGKHSIDTYTFHAGFRVDPDQSLRFSGKSIPPYEDSFQTFVASLQEIIEFSSDYPVELAIENNVLNQSDLVDSDPLVMFCDVGEFSRLYSSISPDDIGVLLDTGHLSVSSNTLGYNQEEFVSEVEGFVKMVHVHSNDGKSDLHAPISADSATVDIIKRFSDAKISIEAKYDNINDLKIDLKKYDILL